jgi:Spy/CpxP family protein refolding chaperone
MRATDARDGHSVPLDPGRDGAVAAVARRIDGGVPRVGALSPTQRDELSSLLSLVGSAVPDGMPRLNEAENVSVAEQVKALEEKISQVLSAQQVKRLSQIELQRRGPFAFKSAEVAKTLNLTADQRKKINAIIEEESPRRA